MELKNIFLLLIMFSGLILFILRFFVHVDVKDKSTETEEKITYLWPFVETNLYNDLGKSFLNLAKILVVINISSCIGLYFTFQ